MRVVTYHFLRPLPSTFRRSSPLRSMYPYHASRRARDRIPTTLSIFCFSFFLSLSLLVFTSARCLLFAPLFFRLYSPTAQFLDDSFFPLLVFSFPPSGRSLFPVICFGSVCRPSSFLAPLCSPLSSDSSWRLSSLDCGSVARLCAIQGGLQGRGIKQTP